MNTTLLVRKDRIQEVRARAADDAPLAQGQVRVAVDLLALTANNVTYAAFGDSMDYWKFFPSGEDGWGIVPAWGFGRVVQSLHPGVAVGEQLYGYWPLGTSAILVPDRLSAIGFNDAAPHRAGLHAVYTQYLRTNADPFHAAGREAVESVFRPLFLTSWLIDDQLESEDGFGARRVLLSSASSKTAYGTAFLMARRERYHVVGLTSAANRAFCESLGCYSQVVTYDELGQLPADEPCVYVDFAGNVSLRRQVHERFTQLKHSSAVGGAHVGQLGGGGGLPGPRPTLFFAPAQAKKRQEEWGGRELQRRMVQDWEAFLARALTASPPWLHVREHVGAQAAQSLFAQLAAGPADPRDGHVVRWR